MKKDSKKPRPERPIMTCQIVWIELAKAARTSVRRGSALRELERRVSVVSKQGRGDMATETRDSQIGDERNGREGNLSRAAELRGEFGGQVLAKLVLEDGGADGDTEDLSERSHEAVEGHLR